jgi:hypothetical protein
MEGNEGEEVEMVMGRMVRMIKEKVRLNGIEESSVNDFIDARLNDQYSKLQANTMVRLAVSCLEEDKGRRPTMEDVTHILVSVDEVGKSLAEVMGGDAQNLHASVYLH